MSDRLIDLEKKINKDRDSLEEAIGSLDSRLGTIEEVLRIAKVEPAETYNFVWAMCQVRHGLHVKCLANGAPYARYDSESDRSPCKTGIEFASKFVNSAWTLAPGYEQSETYAPSRQIGSFDWAMQQLEDGKCIRRRDWIGGLYWKLGTPRRFWLNSDIDADDWEVFYEPHDIKWAAEQLQDDKIVKRRCWKTFRLYPHGCIHLEVDDIVADDWEIAEDA